MKSKLLKITAFTLSLIFGISVFWLSNISIFKWLNSNEIAELSNSKPNQTVEIRKSENLEIKLKEITATEYGFAADFEISNFTEDDFSYWAYGTSEINSTSSTLFKLNGEEIKVYGCGTGLVEVDLKPGETRIFRSNFSAQYWKKNGELTAGFYFKRKTSTVQDYKTLWSKNLPITDELSKHLLIKQQER